MMAATLLAWPAAGEEIILRGERFAVEVARTKDEQQRGLMYRKELAEKSGMLFLYDPPRLVSMWMKHTLIPLDMLFINKNGKIVYIVESTTPGSEKTITAAQPVAAVLELHAGTAKKYAIKTGDRISHAHFTNE